MNDGIVLHAYLNPGTKYTVELPDGSQSEVRTVTEEVYSVVVHWDKFSRIYEVNGECWFVRAEDDV